MVKHASYFDVKPSADCFVRSNLYSSSSDKDASAGDESSRSSSSKHHHRHGRGGHKENASEGASNVTSTFSVKSSYQGKLAVTCTQQKIQMAQGGVFLVQNLYGMDRRSGEEEGGVDTDAPECVICLSEPKEVAVFPCRHMCMCMSCAESLPAQSNNCPICRRPVTLLLRYSIRSLVWEHTKKNVK